MKNYVGFVNDHSGSMAALKQAAIADYNANITATKNAASAEMLDTVVSVVRVGVASSVDRQVVISNPHVLKPVTSWIADGGTPLWSGVLDLIALFESLPDANKQDVSFLAVVTTDGAATDPHSKPALAAKIAEKNRDGRWTFVFRVPKGNRHTVAGLGVPEDNIQEWETTAAGLAQSSAQTQTAMTGYYAARSAGSRSSNTFYTKTTNVDVSKLTDISKETSLYVVNDADAGIWIKDFILQKRTEYLIGAAFYQLTKTEPRVSPTKLILIRSKVTGAVYAGPEARAQLGLDTVNNARINPDHGDGSYDIFIQSESVNRKLVPKSGVLYWAVKGRKMTQADLDKYAPKPVAPVVPAVVQLAQAPATGRPTPNPVSAKVLGPTYNGRKVNLFDKRDEARKAGSVLDLVTLGNGKINGKRWAVYA